MRFEAVMAVIVVSALKRRPLDVHLVFFSWKDVFPCLQFLLFVPEDGSSTFL